MDLITSMNNILIGKFRQSHLNTLKALTIALRTQEYRNEVDAEVFGILLKVLSNLSSEIRETSGEVVGVQSIPLCLQMAAECFRAQRNACVQSPRNQGLLRDLGFLDLSLKILFNLQDMKLDTIDSKFEPLCCGIQFLGNLAVGNKICKDDIWRLTFPDFFLQLLSVDDERTQGYAAMVLHTCLDKSKVEQLAKPENIHVALKVMELCRTQAHQDWTVLIATQHFLMSSALVKNMYSGMNHLERRTLLELLSAQLGEAGSENCGITPDIAGFLADCFHDCCGTVLTLASGSASNEALTVICLLDVLCEMTSDHRQFMFLKEHPDLLITTVALLQQVHALGKSSKNIFSAAQDFSYLSPGEGASASSPSVSFKAHLIRLIGNLCHGHTINQNKVRELEGIPLILDNCNIDSNNPFISQWAIFAIRNLLEQNPQNQEQVAALERRGTADYSALKDLGFEVDEREGSLMLKPIKKDT